MTQTTCDQCKAAIKPHDVRWTLQVAAVTTLGDWDFCSAECLRTYVVAHLPPNAQNSTLGDEENEKDMQAARKAERASGHGSVAEKNLTNR